MAVTANGWPLKDTGLATFTAPNGHVTSVANRSLAIVFAYLVYRWDTEIEPVTTCYGNRTIAAQKAVNPAAMDSNHISATAIDVNGAKHPYELTTKGWGTGFTAAQLGKLREILADTAILQNGIDFSSPYRDPMHVQVRESSTNRYARIVSAAQADAAAQRIGNWVASVQTACGVTADKIMGPGTKQAVLAFQRKHGLVPDGIWGPATQAAAAGGNTPKPTPTPTPTKLTGYAAILAKGGLVDNQQLVVDAAKKVGLPLEVAAAFVEQESLGRNVYGNDPGGALSGAGAVTEANYQTFLQMVRSGHRSNGVGPLQITYPAYFKATELVSNFLWKPFENLVFGLGIIKISLAGNYSDSALDAAAQCYNSGSPTGAPDYGKAIVAKVHRWHSLLNPIIPTPPKVTSTGHLDTGQDLNLYLSKADVAATQRIVGETADGIGGPDTVDAMQKLAGIKPDSWLNPKGSLTIKMYQARIVQQTLDCNLVIDGILGKGTGAAWHDYLSRGGKFTNLANQTLTPVRRHSFPLPEGHVYAVNDHTKLTHSGVSASDRDEIKRIQHKVGVKADGIYGSGTKGGVVKFQRGAKIKADGQVGPKTWKAMGL